VLAAAPLSGSPNLTILTGFDPAPALRLVVLGTALLPVTVLPVFWLMPGIEDTASVLASVGRLLGVILAAAAAAAAVRMTLFRAPGPDAVAALDGLSAIAMAVVVVALMSAIGPMLAAAPGAVAYWVAIAFAVNFGLQIAAGIILRGRIAPDLLVPLSIVAGNRNIALFLVSVPEQMADRLLLFIGCYQIPMYLTPLLLRRFYRPS
jgi:arsenite transporter